MADPTNPIYLLKRAELAVRGCVETALAAVDLTPGQYLVLVLLRCGQASSSAELAREMGVKPQSMTDLIASLTRRGAIVRHPDPANNRILRIALTHTGERLYADATEAGRPMEQDLFAEFSERELFRLKEALARLTAKAEARLRASAEPDKPRRRSATRAR